MNGLSNNFLFILSRSSLNRHVNNFSLTSIDLKLNIFSKNSRLNIFFFNGSFSRYLYRHINNLSFIIYDRFFIFSFSINRSRYNLLSDDRCLDYSLFNDRLLYNFFSNDRLRYYLFCNNWFRV